MSIYVPLDVLFQLALGFSHHSPEELRSLPREEFLRQAAEIIEKAGHRDLAEGLRAHAVDHMAKQGGLY